MQNKNIAYIAELNLNSKSAYKHQVLKMCDAFAQSGFNVSLYVINRENINFKILKKKYLLKRYFKIVSTFHFIKKLNFIFRFFFVIKLFFILKNKNELIYSRSTMASIFFSLFGLRNILEIHQPNTGLTKILFNIFKENFIIKHTKIVVINKNLIKHFRLKKNSYLVADDGVDLLDFKKKYPIKYYSTCVYTGSLHSGKGIEIIINLARKLPNIDFYVYGNINTASINHINLCNSLSNIKLKGYLDYFKIPKVLKSHKIILMPYLDFTLGNHKTTNISKFMSPLKLFDYLSAGRIIIASKNKSYSHILENKNNCLTCNPKNINEWVSKIRMVLAKNFKNANIQKNALKTAKLYTWNLRVNKIVNFIGKK